MALLVAIVVLLVAGITGAATVDTDDAVAVVPRAPDLSGSPTTTTGGASTRADADVPAPGVATTSPESPTTSSTPPADGQPASHLSIPAPGRYTQRVTRSGPGGEPETSELTVIIEDLGGTPDDHRQRRTVEDEDGAQGSSELAWRPDGVYVLSTQLGGVVCTHDPPLLQTPRTLAPGVRWSDDDSCDFSSGGVSGTATIRIDGQVREASTTRVGAHGIPTWTVDLITTIDVTTSFGEFMQRREGPHWVDPARGLLLRSEEAEESTLPSRSGEANRSTARVVTELVGLEPR